MSNTGNLPLTNDDHAAYHKSGYGKMTYADAVKGLSVVTDRDNRESHRAWLMANVPSIREIARSLERCGVTDRHDLDTAMVIFLARERFGLARMLEDAHRKLALAGVS